MRRYGLATYLLLCLTLLPLLASAQVPPPSPPGIRYAIGGHVGPVNNIAVSTDGLTCASASGDSTIKVWRIADGALLRTYTTGTTGSTSIAATSVAFSPDGTMVSAGTATGVIEVWRLSDDTLLASFQAFGASSVASLSFSSDSKVLAAAGADSPASGTVYSIKLFKPSTGAKVSKLLGHTAAVNGIAFSPTSATTLASASSDQTVKIWNTTTGKVAHSLAAFPSTCVAFSQDGTLVAAGGGNANNQGLAAIWNVGTGQQVLAPITACAADAGNPVTAVALLPNGPLLATGGYDTTAASGPNVISTFNASTGALVSTFNPPHDGLVTSLVFSNTGGSGSGTLVSGGADGEIREWDAATGALTSTVTQIYGVVTAATFTSDGSQMALALVPGSPLLSIHAATAQFRAVADGTPLDELTDLGAPFAFSPDGTVFTAFNDAATVSPTVTGTVIMDLLNDTLLHDVGNPTGFTLKYSVVGFSTDGLSVFTYAALDAQKLYTLYVWRLLDGSLQNQVDLNINGISPRPCALSGDGSRIAGIAGYTGTNTNVFRTSDGTLVQSIGNAPYNYSVQGNIALSYDGAYLAIGSQEAVYVYRVSDGALMLQQPGLIGTTVPFLALSPYGDSVAAYRSDGSITVSQINGQPAGALIAYWNDQLGAGITTMSYTPDDASILLGRADGTVLICFNPAPAALSTLTLNQYTADGGAVNPKGTVTSTQSAPAGGIPVTLASSNTAVATVPANTLINPGSTSANFTITTLQVPTPTPVTISATYNGITRTAVLTVNPYVPAKALAFAPSTIQGALNSFGVVTLLHPAKTGGQVVTIVSANPGVADAPATVTVPAGKTSAHFLVQTSVVSLSTPVVMTATAGGVAVKAPLTVVPATVAALSILPSSVQGGVENAVGIVTLSAPTNSDITVKISVTTASTAGDVTYPATVTIPIGALSAVFDIGTNAPKTSKDVVTFKAQIGVGGAGTSSKTANLTVTP